jgi:GH15 family glucan-1,4-alpha-glucosidase
VRPRLRDRGSLGFVYEHRGQVLTLHSGLSLRLAGDGSEAAGRERLARGDRRHVSLTVAHREPAVLATLGDAADDRIDRTVRWWEGWSGRCHYEGPYRDAVLRSAITLKLLIYAPSGAVVAAPTTSLPEARGGVRNWDYRYCWLRDASLTLQALFDLGYREEAEAFLSWLLHTTRAIRLELQVLYDVYGGRRLRETELGHLEGYEGARPVRVGNGATNQLQLDNYGELVDAVYEFVSRGGKLDRQTTRLLRGLGHTVCRRWREPDEGIWEIRGSPRHHTYSKAMCWVALDRLIRLHDEGHLKVPADRFRAERDRIRAEVESRGYNDRVGSYTAAFDDEEGELDASLLLLARYGYADPNSDRLRATYERVRERLGHDGLLFRYRSRHDGLPAGEGAFGICGFWGAEALARQGRTDEAATTLEDLLGYANDVGLFGEEIEPGTGAALGNFPQAFTHVGLIDAALMLAERTGAPGLREPRRRQRSTGVRV